MMSSFLVAADPLSYADDASATPLLDYFPIIVFSETGGAANIFQFISGFAQEFSSGDLWWIGVLAMGVATIAGTIKAFQKQSAGAGAKELIFPVIMAIILLAPSETVRIFDGRTNSSTDVRIVENVPWFVAATASVSSVFTARLMNIVDDASSAISSTTNFNYGAQGLAAPENFALRAIQKIRMDENITTAINTAVKECLVPNAVDSSMFNYIGTYKNVDGDFNSFEAMRQIPINDIDIFNTVMTNGQMCGDYIAQNFSPTVESAFETKIQAVLSNLNFLEIDNLAALSAQYFGMSNHPDVNDTYSQTLANFSGYLKNYNFEGALAGAIVNARAEAIGGGDNTAIIAQTVANASMGNLQTSGIGSWRALSELVPTAHNYLLIIIYGASALMALVVLASGYEKGMMILKEYFFGLMTFEFIKVAFALSNNVMLFYSQERALDLLSGATKNELNPASMPMIGPHLEYLANMAGMAGALGLAAMIMIPGIVFGGKVASAMGVLGNVGGMVQNKSPQSAVEDIAKAKGMQKANADVGMRAELEKAGIHVGPNSDVGSVYSAYMADMDRSAKNTAESSMYRDYDKRYGAVKAQSIQSSAGMIGAGQAAEGYTYDQMKSAGAAVGATGFTGQMAQGQGLIAAGAVDGHGNVKEDYKMGQLGNAQLQATATRVAGREFAKMEFSPDKEGIEAAEKKIVEHGTSAQDHLDQAKELKEKAKNTKDPKRKKDLENQAKEHEKSAESELGLAEKGISNLQATQKSGSFHSGLDAMMQSAIIAGKQQVAQARAIAGQFGYDGENGITRVRNKDANAEKEVLREAEDHEANAKKDEADAAKLKGTSAPSKKNQHGKGARQQKSAKNQFQQKAASKNIPSGIKEEHPKFQSTDLRAKLLDSPQTIASQNKLLQKTAKGSKGNINTKNTKPHAQKQKEHDEDGSVAEKSTNNLNADGLLKRAAVERKAGVDARSRLDAIRQEPEVRAASVDEVLKAEATKAAQSRIGSAMGAMQVMNQTPDLYARTSMMGEMSQAQSSLQKIKAFGSIDSAVGADALSARKSAESFKNDTRAYADSFGKDGKGDDLIKAMTEGGDVAGKKISDAMRSFGVVAYQTAHQGYQSQIGNAKGYVEERAKNGDNYQAKLAESSTKTQAESGMASIKAMQDYKGLSQDAAINSLAHQASRQSYTQTKSIAQDMSMKDQAFGSAGYEDSGMTMARKQSDEAIGATRGIKHELKKNGDKGFQDVAQSGVESQVESGLGAIRGAGGIHSLAWQSGVKAQSDSNALKSSIEQAGGAGAYIGLNEFAARKGISGMQSDRDGFNDEYNSKAKGNIFDKDYKPAGYLGSTGFEGFRLAGAAGAAKGYAEQKGSANAIGNTGTDVFQANAQTETENSAISTKRKIEGAGGAQNYIIASSTAAAGQGASVASDLAGAGSQMNMIQNAAYSSFQKGQQATKEREQDTASLLAKTSSKTGLMETTELGSMAIENDAVEKTVQKKKKANDRGLQAGKIEAALDSNLIDRKASLEAIGIDESALKNGGKGMTAEQYKKIKLNSEKKIDRTEVNVVGTDGDMASTTVRSMAQENADGSLNWKSQVENQSSLENRERGKKINLHAQDGLEAAGKEGGFAVLGEGAMYLAEGAVATVAAIASATGYDSFVKNYSSPGATAAMKNGKTAKMDTDSHWYEVDEKGDFVPNKDGGKTKVDGDLKPTGKKVWDKMFGSDHSADNKGVGDTVAKPMNNTGDISNGGNNDKADSGVHNKSKHETSPSGESSTGSNPSNTHNSTTYPNTPQGNLAKAQQNLHDIKAMAPAEFAKGNMAMMLGEQKAVVSAAHEAGKIPDSEFNSKMVALTQVESKIASGGQITPSELKNAGIGNADLAKSGFVTETKTTPSGKTFQSVDMEASGEHQKVTATNNAQRGVTTARDGVASGKPSAQAPNKSHTSPLDAKRQGLIDGQKGNSPALTKAEYKEQLAAVDGEIAQEKTNNTKSARRESGSMFGDMMENIKNSKVGKGVVEHMDDVQEAVSKTHGSGGKKAMVGAAALFGASMLLPSVSDAAPIVSKGILPQATTQTSSHETTKVASAKQPNPVKSELQSVLEETSNMTSNTSLGLVAASIAAPLENNIGKVAKVASKVAAPVAAAATVIDTAVDTNKRLEKGDNTGAALEVAQGGLSVAGGYAGMTAGASGGAVVGAAIGSVIPIAGTAAGAVVGGAIGGLVGGLAGMMTGEAIGQVALDAHDKGLSLSVTSNKQTSSAQEKPQNDTSTTPSGRSIPSGHSNTANNTHHNDVEQIRPLNESAIAKQQYQDHANRASYVAETLQTGAYQHIQAAVKENPVNPAMVATSNQRMGQEVFAAMAASHNQSTQGSSNAAGAQMTSIDIQQAHQTRQLAQVQADYIREVSRGMDEMVQSLGSLGEHFENFFNKADGKVNEKA